MSDTSALPSTSTSHAQCPTHVDYLVDARNQPCPMPILMLKRQLKTVQDLGKIFLVKSTDPNSQQDLIDFCRIHNLKIYKTSLENQEFHYYIER